MAMLYSNEIKAVVVEENILDNPMSVLKENCLTVQHFSYDCVQKRNAAGEVYGATEPVMLRFRVRVNSPRHAKAFYRALASNIDCDYSFLFNATYKSNNRLNDCDDGMVANGFVVRIEENYHNTQSEDGTTEQMVLDVDFLVRRIIYLGREKNYINTFIK